MTHRTTLLQTLLLAACGSLAACGGGSPLDNAETIQNPAGSGGRKLSFRYFQDCINPILLERISSAGGTNRCADSGCHDNAAGTGGALRLFDVSEPIDVDAPANTPEVIRASDLYKNFYSSQGVTVIGAPTQSRLFQKPLLLNVLHGGGQILASADDTRARRIAYWITHPMPETQDEFSSAGNALFDPATGACRE